MADSLLKTPLIFGVAAAAIAGGALVCRKLQQREAVRNMGVRILDDARGGRYDAARLTPKAALMGKAIESRLGRLASFRIESFSWDPVGPLWNLTACTVRRGVRYKETMNTLANSRVGVWQCDASDRKRQPAP